jgi:uncharacterized protein (TIGR02246 family)
MAADGSVGHRTATRSRGHRVEMMPRISVVVAMIFAIGCASQMRSASGVQHASDAAAIKAVLDTTAAGWNRGDLSTYLSAYIDTATAMGSTGLVRGVSGIEGQMRAGFWRTGRPIQRLSYDHLEIRPIGPDQAIVTGQYILTGGGRPDRTGWFTTIWVRTTRGWRMVHDHSS